MWKRINHELMWSAATAVLVVECAWLWLRLMPLPHELALSLYVSWLLTGAIVLRRRFGYPERIPQHFPRHVVPLALAAFASMLVWPLWSLRQSQGRNR